MHALEIDKAVVAGFDWGARTANIVAALWPERCKGLVSVSGYLIGSQEAGKLPLPPQAELQWWYRFYFALRGGRGAVERSSQDGVRAAREQGGVAGETDDDAEAASLQAR